MKEITAGTVTFRSCPTRENRTMRQWCPRFGTVVLQLKNGDTNGLAVGSENTHIRVIDLCCPHPLSSATTPRWAELNAAQTRNFCDIANPSDQPLLRRSVLIVSALLLNRSASAGPASRRQTPHRRTPPDTRARRGWWFHPAAARDATARCRFIAAQIRLAWTTKPSSPTRPSAMGRAIVVSNNRRSRSLSCKRPWQFVEWSGTSPSSPSRRNQREARFRCTSSLFRPDAHGVADDQHLIIGSGSIEGRPVSRKNGRRCLKRPGFSGGCFI